MAFSFRAVLLGLAALSCGLSGCGLDQHPAYSSNVKYGVRKDPILKASASLRKYAPERDDPDRPGVFPVMKFADIFKGDHPYRKATESLWTNGVNRVAKRTGRDAKAFDLGNLHLSADDVSDFAVALDGVLRDPTQISDSDRSTLESELESRFGTPASPKVNIANLSSNAAEQTALNDAAQKLKLDDKTLAMGSTRYRVHCLHCHGVPGDGRGPTSRWVNPHPRDFRAGLFKFHSIDQTKGPSDRPPSRDDLMRTLREGLEGTAMPSFNLLTDEELESLVSYVMHLAIRGQAERDAINEEFKWVAEGDSARLERDKTKNIKTNVEQSVAFYVKRWAESNEPGAAIVVRPFPFDPNDVEKFKASVKRGQEIFNTNPSPETTKHFVALVLPRRIEQEFQKEVQKVKERSKIGVTEEALKKAYAEAEYDIGLQVRDEMVKEIEKTKGVKLSGNQIDNIHADAVKSDKFKARFEAAKPKIKAALEKSPELPKDLREQIRKKLEPDFAEKAANALKAGNCIQCHLDYGRQARFRFDDWGTLTRPNNLSLGVFRGGRRPVDLYYRIHSGIHGNMPPNAFVGNEEYLWDLVNFLTVLPYPAMREKLGLRID
ncbi:MAG: cytochrome c [Planctomycetes bacterium]|nr:cytochrome c [Planctomycetota bacterium]